MNKSEKHGALLLGAVGIAVTIVLFLYSRSNPQAGGPVNFNITGSAAPAPGYTSYNIPGFDPNSGNMTSVLPQQNPFGMGCGCDDNCSSGTGTLNLNSGMTASQFNALLGM